MVTNPLYKSYSRQIAQLFCVDDTNKILCEAGIEQRLNSFLDDFTYPYFLAKMNSGRQYITELQQFQHRGFRIVLTDLITGLRETAWWDIPYNYPYLSMLPGKLLSHQYNIISANKTFNEQNKSDVRITWNPVKTSYGITFVPPVVPGGGGGNGTPGGGNGTPGGGGGVVITPSANTPANIPDPGGINFEELLKNPIVLIGGAVVLFLLLKDKF